MPQWFFWLNPPRGLWGDSRLHFPGNLGSDSDKPTDSTLHRQRFLSSKCFTNLQILTFPLTEKRREKKNPKHHHCDGTEMQKSLKVLSCWSRGRGVLRCSSALGLGLFMAFLAFTPKTWIQILFHITPVGQRLLSCGQQVPSLRAVDLGLWEAGGSTWVSSKNPLACSDCKSAAQLIIHLCYKRSAL